MITDWCRFFVAIEKDPMAIMPRMTIRDLIAAREHVQECKKCQESCDRVLADAPPEEPTDRIGLN